VCSYTAGLNWDFHSSPGMELSKGWCCPSSQ
jgi:hypothetical protein